VSHQWNKLYNSAPNVLNVLLPFRVMIPAAVNTAGAGASSGFDGSSDVPPPGEHDEP